MLFVASLHRVVGRLVGFVLCERTKNYVRWRCSSKLLNWTKTHAKNYTLKMKSYCERTKNSDHFFCCFPANDEMDREEKTTTAYHFIKAIESILVIFPWVLSLAYSSQCYFNKITFTQICWNKCFAHWNANEWDTDTHFEMLAIASDQIHTKVSSLPTLQSADECAFVCFFFFIQLKMTSTQSEGKNHETHFKVLNSYSY